MIFFSGLYYFAGNNKLRGVSILGFHGEELSIKMLNYEGTGNNGRNQRKLKFFFQQFILIFAVLPKNFPDSVHFLQGATGRKK